MTKWEMTALHSKPNAAGVFSADFRFSYREPFEKSGFVHMRSHRFVVAAGPETDLSALEKELRARLDLNDRWGTLPPAGNQAGGDGNG